MKNFTSGEAGRNDLPPGGRALKGDLRKSVGEVGRMGDEKRKVLLEKIAERFCGSGEFQLTDWTPMPQGEAKAFCDGEGFQVLRIKLRQPGVWRPLESYKEVPLDVIWDLRSDGDGLRRMELDVIRPNRGGNVLSGSLDMQTGAPRVIRFSDRKLGGMVLHYINGELTREFDWCGKVTVDEWQARLGKERLDAFIENFCKSTGIGSDLSSSL